MICETMLSSFPFTVLLNFLFLALALTHTYAPLLSQCDSWTPLAFCCDIYPVVDLEVGHLWSSKWLLFDVDGCDLQTVSNPLFNRILCCCCLEINAPKYEWMFILSQFPMLIYIFSLFQTWTKFLPNFCLLIVVIKNLKKIQFNFRMCKLPDP